MTRDGVELAGSKSNPRRRSTWSCLRGSGGRKGWLSNLHLGARDPETGGFVMLGKTFKGLTDAMLEWQTSKFQELATERSDWVVRVRPEVVVEIAFDGLQKSSTYPGGLA